MHGERPRAGSRIASASAKPQPRIPTFLALSPAPVPVSRFLSPPLFKYNTRNNLAPSYHRRTVRVSLKRNLPQLAPNDRLLKSACLQEGASRSTFAFSISPMASVATRAEVRSGQEERFPQRYRTSRRGMGRRVASHDRRAGDITVGWGQTRVYKGSAGTYSSDQSKLHWRRGTKLEPVCEGSEACSPV